MNLDLSQVWDFHTDLRLIDESARGRQLAGQLDVSTAARMGGLFSAACRLPHASCQEQWQRLEADVRHIESLPGLEVVREVGQLSGVGRQLLHAEGIYFIHGHSDVDLLWRMWDLGFRSIAPLYNEDNSLGGGARGDRARGLTHLGKMVMERAWERGFLVDIAHCNHRTQADAIQLAAAIGRPVHFTHGHLDEPVLELFGQRGLPRRLIEPLARTGGLIGLSPHPGFVGYFTRYLDEIAFLAGEVPQSAVLGSDFSGITTPPVTFEQFSSARHTPAFAELLAERHGEQFAADFCGRSLRDMLARSLPG